MELNILPAIGTSGIFELKAPLNGLLVNSENYTCKAIRKISEYLANNEDPSEIIYKKYGLSSSDYEEATARDESILSLQSGKGHWVYAPSKFIVKYPDTNGVPYRTMTVAAALPALEANFNYEFLCELLSDIVKDTIGIAPIIKMVESSKVVLVPEEIHRTTQMNRNIAIANKTTDRARYRSLLIAHQSALDKIQALETYIKENL